MGIGSMLARLLYPPRAPAVEGDLTDEEIDAWRQTAEILGDEETMADIAEAEKQIEKGEVASWDVVKQRLHTRSS